jgi:hypothetical protein
MLLNTHMTEILRSLTPLEIRLLQDVCVDPLTPWKSHVPIEYMNLTALRDGKSMHIRFFDEDFGEVLAYDNRHKYPALVDTLRSIGGNRDIGRTYIHKLGPGQEIIPHRDGSQYFNHVHTRYHLYLDIPPGSLLILDDEKKNIDMYANKLVQFTYDLNHQYKNNGTIDWYVCVFDALES